MDELKHILLLANSLTNEEITQVQKVIGEMQQKNIAFRISLLYVKPYFPTCYFHIPSMVSLSEEFEEEAKQTLEQLGSQLNIPCEHQWIATGRIRPETLKMATTLGVDFVLSSNSVHRDLSQLFGFKRQRSVMLIKTIDAMKAA